jgi:hypothetical protein
MIHFSVSFTINSQQKFTNHFYILPLIGYCTMYDCIWFLLKLILSYIQSIHKQFRKYETAD